MCLLQESLVLVDCEHLGVRELLIFFVQLVVELVEPILQIFSVFIDFSRKLWLGVYHMFLTLRGFDTVVQNSFVVVV